MPQKEPSMQAACQDQVDVAAMHAPSKSCVSTDPYADDDGHGEVKVSRAYPSSVIKRVCRSGALSSSPCRKFLNGNMGYFTQAIRMSSFTEATRSTLGLSTFG